MHAKFFSDVQVDDKIDLLDGGDCTYILVVGSLLGMNNFLVCDDGLSGGSNGVVGGDGLLGGSNGVVGDDGLLGGNDCMIDFEGNNEVPLPDGNEFVAEICVSSGRVDCFV